MRMYAAIAVLIAASSAGCMTSSEPNAVPAAYLGSTDRVEQVDRSNHLWQVEKNRREYKIIHDPSVANAR